MGFLKILVPVVLAGLAFGMYRNVRKVRPGAWSDSLALDLLATRWKRLVILSLFEQVQFTSLVIPEEKKQSVKEFFNTLKEIPAIMDEVQSTLQVCAVRMRDGSGSVCTI